MINPATQEQLRKAIAGCIDVDRGVLDSLRAEIRPLKGITKRIGTRSTASISMVAADGGNNQLRFDPFLIQLVRVVDSSNQEYCLEAVSPTTPIEALDRRQFSEDGKPVTRLGEMMAFLGVSSLPALSHMIRPSGRRKSGSSAWIQAYRELIEWATLFNIFKKDFATDTLIVFDGLLRSKVFADDLFQKLLEGIKARIDERRRQANCRVYLAGVAKQSKVLSRYRLAMTLEGVLQTDYPAYVEMPPEIEEKAYNWPEFVWRGDWGEGSDEADAARIGRYVAGKMFLVKFGSHRHDSVWPVDIFVPQLNEAEAILGSLLSDAINGFPMPNYPCCLQRAHEYAALVDFDLDILQDAIYDEIRLSLSGEGGALDAFQLQDADPAQRRYK